MTNISNMRRVALTIMLIVGLVAVAVPACMMAQCTMTPAGMPFSPGSWVHATCTEQQSATAGPISIVPPTSQSLILTLIVALAGAILVFSPPMVSRRVLVRAESPPASPQDPRGERLLI